jgi:SRSO17 transposase
LYFQKKWFDDEYKDRRENCDVPDDKVFQTKNEIALTQIKSIVAKNLFHVKWFGCDSAFGCDHVFWIHCLKTPPISPPSKATKEFSWETI